MSRARKDLKNTKTLSKKYVSWLKKIPFVKGVYLSGSRAKGTNRRDSDWDLVILTDRKLSIPDPRVQFKFHCDVLVVQEERYITDDMIKL